MEDIFTIIKDYHQLKLGSILTTILETRECDISELHRMLQAKKVRTPRIQSLYRYFTDEEGNRRIPSEEFIRVFAEVMDLSPDEQEFLVKFYKFYKQSSRKNGKRNH